MSEEQENGNPKIYLENGMQAYLHYKFIFSGQYNVETVSKKMGCSASKIYKFIEYGSGFGIDDFIKYMDATGDMEFLEWLAKRYGRNLASPLPKSIRNLLNEILRVYSPEKTKE